MASKTLMRPISSVRPPRHRVVARYLQQLDTADRQEPSEALQTKTSRLKEKIEKLKEQMQRLNVLKVQMLATPDQQNLANRS